jgi:hypothetical protein
MTGQKKGGSKGCSLPSCALLAALGLSFNREGFGCDHGADNFLCCRAIDGPFIDLSLQVPVEPVVAADDEGEDDNEENAAKRFSRSGFFWCCEK